MKRKSGRKTNKKEENDSNGVEDTEQNGETSDYEEEDAPKDKRRKSSKGGRKNAASTGKKDKEDATSTAESDASEEVDQEEESHKEEKKSKGRKSSKKEKETDPLAESEEDAEEEVEKKKSPKKGKKATKKEKDKKEDKSKDNDEPEEDEDDESQYEVEAVLDEKNMKGVRHYLIRWKGYEEESDTWEPENTLECSELIAEFKEKKKKDKGNKKPVKKEKKESEKLTWDENADYEVNRILEVHHLRGGKREFLINWKGYSQSENTWEPEENLDCKELIERFMAKVDKARELEDRELRVNRKQVQRYTLNPQAEARRMSRRFRDKERVQYHDAE